ncbi:MAG TPA: heavy metal transporter, partial [Clostridia bacterium]|nr:heavy metal transporter [Clostridia bacterium]
YNCWMGMIRGTITVVEAGAKVPDSQDSAGNAWTIAAPDAANPTPSGYAIPTDGVAVATLSADEYGDFQEVSVDLTDRGFSPAILVVQAGLDVQWHIVNQSSGAASGTQLLIPAYYAQLALNEGDNPLYFFPDESFDFSTGDNAFYGYVKVVGSLDEVDVDAIKAEVSAIETLSYPPDYFQSPGGGSCCQ